MARVDITYPGDTITRSITALVRQPVSPSSAPPLDVGLVEISMPTEQIPGPAGPPGPGVIVSDTPPADPYDGALWWESDTGVLWAWYEDPDSAQWVQISGGTGSKSSVIIADTAPTGAENGQLWWNSANGNLYCWYNDGDSAQWVQINTDTSASGANGARVTPFMFGGIGDGVTDDTAAINAAINFLYTQFVGGEVDMSGGKWLVDSGNVVVKMGVTLKGAWRTNGQTVNADWPQDVTVPGATFPWYFERSAIILNPLYTVLMNDPATGIEGMGIFRKGLSRPAALPTTRAYINEIKAFSGKAITTIGESYVGHCFIVGFSWAVYASGGGRTIFEYISGDCANGIHLSQSLDMQHLSHCHFWPYQGNSATIYAVTGAANNGSGLIRLTLASHVIVTGDIVVVYGIAGTVEANGRWTATVIDATHIDLQGTAFANAYVSGGNVNLGTHPLRGTGYHFDDFVDWGQADNCHAYGYTIGFDIFQSNHTAFMNCGTDHVQKFDNTTIGFRIRNSQACKLIGCRTAAAGTGVVVDTGTGYDVSLVGHDFWGLYANGLSVLTGHATVVGGQFSTPMPVGILIDPASEGVNASGNKSTSAIPVMVSGSGAGLRRSTFINNNWNDVTIGEREVVTYGTVPDRFFSVYNSAVNGAPHHHQRARPTIDAPAAPVSGDSSFYTSGEFWDGVSAFRVGATYRIAATATTSPTSSPARHVWGVTAAGAVTPVDRIEMTDAAFAPLLDANLTLGTSSMRWNHVYSRLMALINGVTAPGPITGHATIYIDVADGAPKIKYPSGTVKTFTVT